MQENDEAPFGALRLSGVDSRDDGLQLAVCAEHGHTT